MAIELSKLLSVTVEKNASDIHLDVGRPPTLRLHGRLRPLNIPVLQPQDTEAYVKEILPERCKKDLEESGGADFGFTFETKARFRSSAFKQKGCYGLALRLIPSKLLTFEQIGLPEAVRPLLTRPRGLILVTGPTGSGKTTTLATMIDTINTERDCHIVTIEDPVEYYHEHKMSIITQRELGADVSSFAEGLRRALRMDPDVILVGEMRDLETISTAITAAETGHLVFGTLHTTGSARTINRIIDAFPQEQQEQIRAQLSTSVIAVISQMLLPKADGSGIIAAFEVMLMTSAIQNNIRENQTHKIVSAIQTGGNKGMVMLDDYLLMLYRQKKISYDDMLEAAQDQEEIVSKLNDHQSPKR